MDCQVYGPLDASETERAEWIMRIEDAKEATIKSIVVGSLIYVSSMKLNSAVSVISTAKTEKRLIQFYLSVKSFPF
jgi:hypothetical protein